jgi:hypothetical protein
MTANLLHTGVEIVIGQLSDETVIDFIGIRADVDRWMDEALVDFGGREIGRRELSASQLHRLHGMYCGYMVPTLEELGIGVVLEVSA